MSVKPLRSLRVKLITVIIATLVLMVGGSYYYIVQRQSGQFVETTKEQARILTHAIVKSIQHDMRGTCLQDIQGIFERIGIIPDIESLRIFDEEGMVSKSGDPREVGLTIEDIGLEIFKANIPSTPYRGGHGYNSFCMVETIRNDQQCRLCHETRSDIIGIFELCLSMEKTDKKIAKNRKFLIFSAFLTIALVAVILSIFLTLQVNRPVEKLVKVMHQAESGDMEARADIRRDDELGMLAGNFNTMIKRLEETQKKVERFHTDQLIRAERLATIGELAASVAHEIKNPLAGISGAVQVLSDDLEDRDPRKKITEQIIRQTERMDKTIKDLLNYAQPLEAELTRVEVPRILDAGLFICLPNPGKWNVTVEKDYAPDIPAIVTDAKHLEQVFVNVILNAVQSMPGGGRLTLGVSRYERQEEEGALAVEPAVGIRVSVSDTGSGIPEDVGDKIFSPFYTTRTEGTGLGLSITSRILEIHRGRIYHESNPDGGTTFHIEVPLDNTGSEGEA